ncbi:MAG TPA: hypothetical protein VHS76_14825 [Steroidobacteraceae bacterium]|jgi:hypothetical protein|nr:hypothetical protein [Steroidobacteraceae bacterium]
MKVLMGCLGAVAFLAGASSALGDAACEKCTHEMQVQYRTCLRNGKDQATCSKEQMTAAQACIEICNTKVAAH